MAFLDVPDGGDAAKGWHRQVDDRDVRIARCDQVGGLFDEGRPTADDELIAPVARQQQLEPLGEEFVVVDDDHHVRPLAHGPDARCCVESASMVGA